ncbi:MAG: hypothetical protein N4A71_20540 [Carboxylicivirga sp.]|jgi:asparagine N-glycosylation enzyme membrane subunit Stt3|nr:hypothetical protein [Carboxylicivirga sp.]
MKTSKIILIAFLSVFILSLLSLLITVENEKFLGSLESVDKTFTEIKAIKITKDAQVNIHYGDQNKISLKHYKDSTYTFPFVLKGDTLVLVPHKQNDRNWSYSVYVNKPLKTIYNQGGNISISLNQESLSVVSNNNSRLDINNKTNLKYLNLDISQDSKAYFYNSQIQKLHLKCEKAKVRIDNPIDNLKLIATLHSNVTFSQVKHLSVECDETSKYRVY